MHEPLLTQTQPLHPLPQGWAEIYIYDKDLRKEKCFYDRFLAGQPIPLKFHLYELTTQQALSLRQSPPKSLEWNITIMSEWRIWIAKNLRTTQTMHDIKARNNLNFMEIFPSNTSRFHLEFHDFHSSLLDYSFLTSVFHSLFPNNMSPLTLSLSA